MSGEREAAVNDAFTPGLLDGFRLLRRTKLPEVSKLLVTHRSAERKQVCSPVVTLPCPADKTCPRPVDEQHAPGYIRTKHWHLPRGAAHLRPLYEGVLLQIEYKGMLLLSRVRVIQEFLEKRSSNPVEQSLKLRTAP